MTKKMCVIGDAAVGKTSLIRRYVIDQFDDKYLLTVGFKVSAKEIRIVADGEEIGLTLQIWDVIGQKGFGKIQQQAYHGAKGALLVLDLTRRETLYSFDLWLSSLYEVAGEIPVIVLANKNDLEPEFGKNEIEELVKGYGFPYYITSAKTGENVNDAFNILGEMMIKPWIGAQIRPKLDLSKVFEGEMRKEPGEKLTALVVEDTIVARFCELIEDTELAMDIIREQIQKVGLDFRHPTPQGLTKVVDSLLNAVSERVDTSRLEKEKRDYLDLIERIVEDRI